MATIPLPALHVNPPQPAQDPLENYARLMQLRNQSQMQPLQMQAAQQQVQAGQLENQQREQDLKDKQAMTSAMQGWDGKDYNEILPLVLKNGGSAQAVMGLKSKILEQQQSISTTVKNNGEGAKAQFDAAKTKGDLLDGALAPLIDPKQVPDEQLSQALMATAQDLAQRGVLDPQHAQQAAQLASQPPQQIRQQLDLMRKSNMAQSQILEAGLKQAQTGEANARANEVRGKLDPTSPLYAPSSASVAMGTAPGAAQIQAGEVKQAAAKAGAEERARMPGEMALAAQKQALSQGDPKAAAQLMIDGDATLSELKSRGATPEFIAKTLFYAHQLSGGRYNAPAADAQFNVAKSQANTAFFGSAGSLVSKGGTLDQLAAAAKDIPQGQIPVFNSIADAMEKAKGSGPIAKYAALVVGASDDYSKVMGGGTGSDSSRAQALNLIPANASPEARAAAIEGIRGAVSSQMESRIGANPTMQRMYGPQLPAKASPQAAISVTAPNGKTYIFKDQASADAFKQKAGIQ